MLRKRTDAEFMTDENEPSAREERLAIIEKELLDIRKDIENLEYDIGVLEDEYEELLLEAVELKSYQER